MALLVVWAALLCCVVLGSLMPANSRLMVAVASVPVSDKALHFFAYLALSALPVLGFRITRHAVIAVVSVFLLGVILESGQYFALGRTAELRDLFANTVGVTFGVLLGLPMRPWLANSC